MLADYGLSEEQGNEIIMAARAHWFEDEAARNPGRTRLRNPRNDTLGTVTRSASDEGATRRSKSPERTCVLTRRTGAARRA